MTETAAEHTNPQLTSDSLMAILGEAQQTVRSYDTKAQIVGVGYIFALGVVMRSGDHIPIPIEYAAWYVLAGWLIIVVPIIMFALVLYPSRIDKTSTGQMPKNISGAMYFDRKQFPSIQQYADAVRDTDWVNEITFEIAKVSNIRDIKRVRFLRALYWTGGSFAILFLSQMLRAGGFLAQ